MKIKTQIYRTFTGIDNSTLDIGRILWAAGVLAFFAMSIHSSWHGQVFDPISWGTGFGAVMAAGGAALWMKRATEPQLMMTQANIAAMQAQPQANTTFVPQNWTPPPPTK